MNENSTCLIWRTPAIEESVDGRDGSAIDSPRAGGKYFISGTAMQGLQSRDDLFKARLTSWLVEQRRLGNSCPEISSVTIREAEQRKALRVSERVTSILKYLEEMTTVLGTTVHYHLRAYPDIDEHERVYVRVYFSLLAHSECVGRDDLFFLLNHLDERGLVRNTNTNNPLRGCVLTVEGYGRLAELEGTYTDSSRAFVAMWFHPSMREAWEHAIKPAISGAGYTATRIDQKEYINKVDDEIIAEIRRSRFVVADFTHGDDGSRGGVYYEAGFAHGLDIPVVFSCQEDVFERIHFDTRQYNHIVWKEPEELRHRLTARIAAVVGDGPLKNGDS